MRRFALLGGAGIVLAFAVSATPAFAQSGGGCLLNGTATLSPGLNSSSQPFSYGFTGSLTNCVALPSGPSSGTEEAGQVVTINGLSYQEPIPTGSGGCASSTTSGYAISRWAGGGITVVQYSTTGALAAVALTGSVVPSVTVTPTASDPVGTPPTTINTTLYAGGSALGLLAFQPPDPTACTTSAGVTTAGISGFIGLGTT